LEVSEKNARRTFKLGFSGDGCEGTGLRWMDGGTGAGDIGARGLGEEAGRRALVLDGPRQEPAIYLTNYESVRDGKLDVSLFSGVSLDEASILRGFGGSKTFREFMRLFEGKSTYRFVATATPSPNEFIELLAYAAFLDVMDVGQAKTRFFKRNSTNADDLTLHPHKEREFWLWVSSWAIFLQRPSDLGYSDEGYDLPELDIHWHEINTSHDNAGAERSGQGRLLKNAALGLQDAAREKRESLPLRVAKLMELGSSSRARIASSGTILKPSVMRSRMPSRASHPSTGHRTWTSASRPSSSFLMG
jgi:hypothetical protein